MEYKKRFKAEYNGNIDFRDKHQEGFSDIDMSKEDVDELIARYDGEIYYVDFELGRFISYLRKQDLLKKTIIVITADHGETLAERGLVGHGYGFNTIVQVPLIVFPARDYRRRNVDNIVELIDIAPSILGWLDIEPPSSFKGIDIFSPRNQIGKEFEFSENYYGFTIRRKDYIFKIKKESKDISLYSLKSDPFEGYFYNCIT